MQSGGLRYANPPYELGAEPARCDAYAGAAVLRRFAARPVIYPDSSFAATYDRRARANLARELAALI
ncbi:MULTISPECIES: hypothetical protein [unclassified Bradyrhizobium]